MAEAGRAFPRWIPRSARLSTGEWAARHRIVWCVLVVHLVVLPLWLSGQHTTDWQAWAGVAAMATFATVAFFARFPRIVRASCAAFGLLTATGVVAILAGGEQYAAFHVAIVITFIALYEDWPTYLAAIGYVVVQHVLALVITPDSLRTVGVPGWQAPALHAALVLAVCATQIVFWHFLESSRSRERDAHHQLSSGEERLRSQMDELSTQREQLVATVSHEFRTPLTAIRGSALTLRRRRHRLANDRADELLDGIVANTERLSRLLENMLAAAAVHERPADDVSDVYEVANEVAMVVHGQHAGRRTAADGRPQPVMVSVPRRLRAQIERDALHQVLANLVDNAVVHAAPGSQALLTGAREGDTVVVTVANEAHGIDSTTLAGLFEPFTLADASDTRTRAGAGVGLYVVRRLVAAAHGTVSVHSEPGWVSVEVRLPAAVDAVAGADDAVVDLRADAVPPHA